MLVLGRQPGETIVIGDVVVTILSARPGRVSVGIEAPQDVKVLRGELVDDEEAA
jgi:carbon storage regulator